MLNRRQLLLEAYRFLDVFLMAGSFAFATWVTLYYFNRPVSFEQFVSMRIKVHNLALFIGFLYMWRALFSAAGLYESMRLSTRSAEAKKIIKATSVGTLTLFIASVVFSIQMMTPAFIAVFWVADAAMTIASRLFIRRALMWLRLQGRNLRHVLIVGTNQRAVRFAGEIESKPELGYRLLGYVENGWRGNDHFKGNGHKIVSDFGGFASFIREKPVDEVVFYLPVKSFYEQISAMAMLCTEQGVIVRYPPDIFSMNPAHSSAGTFEGIPLVTHYTGTMRGWQIHLKRLMDVALSSFGLLLLSPLFLLTAFAVRFTSPGPIFFVQERVGLNKRRFGLCKFRTMVADAEKRQAELEAFNEASGPVFKIKNDPRVTRVGRLLRKTSIDELPQLWNVLKGDMSLVGPRPLPLRDYRGFDKDWQRRRFSVRPGITCLWQVNGRSEVSFENWMKLDMNYIDSWSLWLDIEILVKTIPAVMRGSGAA